jgi:hypothetical protein
VDFDFTAHINVYLQGWHRRGTRHLW